MANFGTKLAWNGLAYKQRIFQRAAFSAMNQDKTGFPDTVVTRWKVVKDFWKMPLNLSEVDGRHNVKLLDDISTTRTKTNRLW